MNVMQIVAQAPAATGPATHPVDPPWYAGPMVPIIVLVVIMYVYMFRQKGGGKDRSRTDMLANMKKGDEIQTIGGEFGRVVEVKDDRVLVKVDETSNTKIWYSRNAIHRVVTDDKAKAETK